MDHLLSMEKELRTLLKTFCLVLREQFLSSNSSLKTR